MTTQQQDVTSLMQQDAGRSWRIPTRVWPMMRLLGVESFRVVSGFRSLWAARLGVLRFAARGGLHAAASFLQLVLLRFLFRCPHCCSTNNVETWFFGNTKFSETFVEPQHCGASGSLGRFLLVTIFFRPDYYIAVPKTMPHSCDCFTIASAWLVLSCRAAGALGWPDGCRSLFLLYFRER